MSAGTLRERAAALFAFGSEFPSSKLLREEGPFRPGDLWTRERLLSPATVLVTCVAALCALGLIMVFSASSIESVESNKAPYADFVSQAVYMLLSYGVFFALTRTHGTFWTGDAGIWTAWAATLALLVAVLAVGSESHGATRWIHLGPVGLQPSEFAKITLVLVCARLFAEWDARAISWRRLLAMLVVFVAVPLVLILLQKDLGTVIIIGTTLLFMAFMSGIRVHLILAFLAVAVATVFVLIKTSGYRSQRLSVWLNPRLDYYGDGWQLSHSLFAFGSGGFFGAGLGNSAQKYSYLPEAHNDFIFAIIGEELGFVGAVLTIALFVAVGWAGMRISAAAAQRHMPSSLAAFGLTCSLMVQALLNMCGVLQILPLTGRPLPFISAGGSSILSCMIMVGLLAAIAQDNEDHMRSPQFQRAERKKRLTVIEGGSNGRTEHATVKGR